MTPVGATQRTDRVRVFVLRLLVILAVAAAWEAASRFEILNSTEFPPISEVSVRFATTLAEESTWAALGQTVLGWFVGMLIATVVGVMLALFIGSSRFLTRSTSLLIDVLRSTPAPAIIFILVLVLGTTLTMKVTLIVSAAIFPILIQTLYGVRGIDPVLRDLQRSYRVGRVVAFVKIRVPAAMPFIATGVRIASSLALIVGVVAEYLVGADGVGALVDDVRLVGDYERMYALILLVGFLSVALTLLVLLAERRLLHWHPTHRRTS
jgi:ABC-type nitrate/sulfonate/bicarbonate transport system permease component